LVKMDGADEKEESARHTREEKRSLFWMQVEGVCPDPFIYFTLYLAAPFYTLRI
jgi:hypothetical protein